MAGSITMPPYSSFLSFTLLRTVRMLAFTESQMPANPIFYQPAVWKRATGTVAVSLLITVICWMSWSSWTVRKIWTNIANALSIMQKSNFSSLMILEPPHSSAANTRLTNGESNSVTRKSATESWMVSGGVSQQDLRFWLRELSLLLYLGRTSEEGVFPLCWSPAELAG